MRCGADLPTNTAGASCCLFQEQRFALAVIALFNREIYKETLEAYKIQSWHCYKVTELMRK